MKCFKPYEIKKAQEYYNEKGYVVFSKVIPEINIWSFYQAYQKFKKSKFYFFYSQDTNQTEKLHLTDEGLLEHSILNPTDLIFKRSFCQSALDITCSAYISSLLTEITGFRKHTLLQSMFFDKSTGTVAHQDHYYLDSDPPGRLVAAWFALEEIVEDSGAFFVAPGSHRGPLVKRKTLDKFSNHKEYLIEVQDLIQSQRYTLKPMYLSRGDVLFWHPFLVHGSFRNQNPNISRKSFTAHYIPDGYKKLHIDKFPAKILLSTNPNIYVLKRSKSKFQALKKYWRSVVGYYYKGKRKIRMDMRYNQPS